MRALVGSNPGRLAICAISELLLVEAPSWAVALLVTPRSVPVPLPPPLSDCCTLTAGDSAGTDRDRHRTHRTGTGKQ
uniref:Putative secreted protein n=1 Tax=Anopheles darlingi TaxID=43151 RepID=A0A2M4DG18_ANODA